jgi:hypothetical protein
MNSGELSTNIATIALEQYPFFLLFLLSTVFVCI